MQIPKDLNIYGTNYPKVNGFVFQEQGGTGTINGFSIMKSGVEAFYAGSGGTIRNNYFTNCGIYIGGGTSSGITTMNNQITGGTISLYDTRWQVITGNTISNSKCGLYIGDSAGITSVSKNTFKNCGYAVYFWGYDHDPGYLPAFSGNKYIKNKVNFGWGTGYF